MGEIRSAFEIAMEKADKLGKMKPEELESRKWNEEGKRIAASFLAGKVDRLQDRLQDVPGRAIRHVLEGATECLLRNVVLPRDKDQWRTIERALKGLIELKGSMAQQVVPRIEELLRGYEQTMDSYIQQFKAQVQAQGGVEGYGAGGPAGERGRLDLNAVAAMEQEWSRISSEIAEQFERQLAPLKEYLR